MQDTWLVPGPLRLLQQLKNTGAAFRVVGSVARDVTVPSDLDIVVSAGHQLAGLLAAMLSVGATSRMSAQMPTARQLRQAGLWQFETGECALDVFVEPSGENHQW